MGGDTVPGLIGKFLLGVLLVSGVTTTVFTLRLVVESRRLFLEGERLEQGEGAPREAVLAYEKAARAYIPGNTYCDKALWKLTILARSAEMRGETRDAVYIWEVLRRSVLSTRHFVQPNENYLVQAETAIGSLRAEEQDGVSDRPSRPTDPSPAKSLLLFLGLLLWIGGAIALWIGRIFHRKGSSHLVSVGVSLFGLVLWLFMAWSA